MAKKTDSKKKPAAPAKRATKPAAKNKPAVKAKPAAKTIKSQASSYTSDDIALRAYFISEKRRAQGLPGDEYHDWLEAERQLAAENKRTQKAKKA